MNQTILPKCSFCQQNHEQVDRLIAGPEGIFICNECVQRCLHLLNEETPTDAELDESQVNLLPPKEILAALDEYVIGQEQAKRVLSVAVYNHYKRVLFLTGENAPETVDVELDKSNILIAGPTGCGKTILAQTLARILEVPFSIVDATAMTEAGYVGEDVENILLRLIQVADGDIKSAEKGIIYVDEIDKIARKSMDNPSITRDVSGEGVQQALLKIIEGTVANVPPQGGRKHPHQEFLQIDTSNILFICGGTFAGIEDDIAKRIGARGQIGFGQTMPSPANDRKALLNHLSPEDLMAYGLIPELVGRLPVTTCVHNLEQSELVKILTEPRNALISQYKKLFALDDVELIVEAEALETLAEMSLNRGTGARGLRSLLEHGLMDIMFEIPSSGKIRKVILNPAVFQENQRPRIIGEDGQELSWTKDGHLDTAA
ncbi:MAG: ATP-dependent Clp protease ATP-binding subunit ClpX [Chloroflexi bacterium]|nr:ATP-dependent Clp protease ATP-binding subunit ClpX [Chloroflexota bacterium]MCY4008447.1 ATP-dependent Clp protease ATP-binding subunit ClpX [Anaerolineaceae bacterium]MCY4105113.1 ATP-dependent Clp protease ATP-binding subunit ClpX [Chloroflexota bacterium]